MGSCHSQIRKFLFGSPIKKTYDCYRYFGPLSFRPRTSRLRVVLAEDFRCLYGS